MDDTNREPNRKGCFFMNRSFILTAKEAKDVTESLTAVVTYESQEMKMKSLKIF